MICCDTCEEWYHGSCVGITRKIGKDLAQKKLKWVCSKCIKGNGSWTTKTLSTEQPSRQLTSKWHQNNVQVWRKKAVKNEDQIDVKMPTSIWRLGFWPHLDVKMLMSIWGNGLHPLPCITHWRLQTNKTKNTQEIHLLTLQYTKKVSRALEENGCT